MGENSIVGHGIVLVSRNDYAINGRRGVLWSARWRWVEDQVEWRTRLYEWRVMLYERELYLLVNVGKRADDKSESKYEKKL